VRSSFIEAFISVLILYFIEYFRWADFGLDLPEELCLEMLLVLVHTPAFDVEFDLADSWVRDIRRRAVPGSDAASHQKFIVHV